MLDRDLKELELFERGQFNPGKKLVQKISSKWYYIVIIVLVIGLAIYLMYHDVTKNQFTIPEKVLIEEGVKMNSNNESLVNSIILKTREAGKFKPEYLIIVLLAVVAYIAWLTLSNPEIELDMPRVDLIARKIMDFMIGPDRKFPQGTTYSIMDIFCTHQGTLGLTSMTAYKWLIKVRVTVKNVPNYYILEIRHPDGRSIAMKDMPKDFDREFRDKIYTMSRDVATLGNKRYGLPPGMSYQDFDYM